MTGIEKIRRYIDDTKIPAPNRYELRFREVIAMKSEPDTIDALYTAFLYGRAKGYRAAKAESREAVQE